MNLDRFTLPFEFTDSDLKELVIKFKEEIDKTKTELANSITRMVSDFSYIDKNLKNEKNNLSKEYFDNHIKDYSLNYFTQITDFLQNPINSGLAETYEDLAFELNRMITINRDNFAGFEEIFEHLYRYVKDKNETLKHKKRFISIFLHYMYFHCDIGKKV